LDLVDSRITYNLKSNSSESSGKLFMERIQRDFPSNIISRAQEIRTVKLFAKLKDYGDRKGKGSTFDLSSDGSTTLHNDQNDRVILQMLIASEIIHG
jgi:hypothetical protein